MSVSVDPLGGKHPIGDRRKLFIVTRYVHVCVPYIGHGFRRTLVGLKLQYIVMSETQFIIEEIERDGERMLRVQTVDTSGAIGRVIDSMILTQNLEPHIDGETLNISDNERSDTFPETSDIESGDIVFDSDAPKWTDSSFLLVKEVTDIPADEYYLNGDEESYTVADKNPDYKSDSPVIECRPRNGFDSPYVECQPRNSSDTYLYPYVRLELTDYEHMPKKDKL